MKEVFGLYPKPTLAGLNPAAQQVSFRPAAQQVSFRYSGVLSYRLKAREGPGSEHGASSSLCSAAGRRRGRSRRARSSGADAPHRRARQPGRGRSGKTGPQRGVPAGAAAIGLDRRPQRADRLLAWRGRCRAHSQIRGGIGHACAGRHPGCRQHAAVGPLLQATRTVPIVFVQVADPVGAGYVESLARPGGNATGFANFEYGLSAKWLELLKEIAPRVTRAAVLRDPAIAAGIGQFGAIQAVAPSLGVEVSPVNVRDAREIERAVAAFARSANGGLIVTGSPLAIVHRELIVTLAARHRLPAVYCVARSSPAAA